VRALNDAGGVGSTPHSAGSRLGSDQNLQLHCSTCAIGAWEFSTRHFRRCASGPADRPSVPWCLQRRSWLRRVSIVVTTGIGPKTP